MSQGTAAPPLAGPTRIRCDEILVGNFHTKRHQESGRSCSLPRAFEGSVCVAGEVDLVGLVDLVCSLVCWNIEM